MLSQNLDRFSLLLFFFVNFDGKTLLPHFLVIGQRWKGNQNFRQFKNCAASLGRFKKNELLQ